MLEHAPPSHDHSHRDLYTSVCESIERLVTDGMITSAQAHIASAALRNPRLALIAEHAFFQGTSPDFFRLTLTSHMKTLARKLELSLHEAHQVLRNVACIGPGALKVNSSAEWLWLTLARFSMSDEERPATPEATFLETARRTIAAEQYLRQHPDIWNDAHTYRLHIIHTCRPVGWAPQGNQIPLYAEYQFGFYAAFRTGYAAAAIQLKNGRILYGTNGTVTLEDLGIVVELLQSPYLGIAPARDPAVPPDIDPQQN